MLGRRDGRVKPLQVPPSLLTGTPWTAVYAAVMPRKSLPPSQLLDLLLGIAKEVGLETDRELAQAIGVSTETVINWRTGAVQELKPQKLEAVKRALAARIAGLREQAGHRRAGLDLGLVPIEVEQDSSPAELHRKLRELIYYHYLGHRFLYFEPQGALAWERLISQGYEQDLWLESTRACAEAWLNPARATGGGVRGPLAEAAGLGRKQKLRGLDVISLGPGEGGKEELFLQELLRVEEQNGTQLPWVFLALADVSIALLLKAATATRRRLADHERLASVLPVCSDFEEGSLHFLQRLPTQARAPDEGVRLVLILGNVFGNLYDEATFVRGRLQDLCRRGDFVWIEVGVRPARLEDDPLYRMTQSDREATAVETSRRLLLEGPYRRWEVALGRPPGPVDVRVWAREKDDASRVPGSVNFCHDLILKDQNRSCTMLYSRRYDLDGLQRWLETHELEVVRTRTVKDGGGVPRVAHLLLRRR